MGEFAHSQQKDVVFLWEVEPQLKDYIQNNLAGERRLKLIFPEDFSEENLKRLMKKAHVSLGWRPPKSVLEAAEELQIHFIPGVGVRHLIGLFRELNRKRPITLINGHGNTYFVAQHVVGILLTLMNKLILHHNRMREGKWRSGDEEGKSTPLRERHVGLLGYGAINQKVHRFLSGFHIQFSILKRSSELPKSLPTPAKIFLPHQLHEFLDEVDILIVAIPETSETIDLIGTRELKLLGETGIIINVGRGMIIREEALYQALKNSTIAAAGIDVWYDYHPDPDNEGKKYPFHYPFHELNNIVLSPHRAASPFDDLKRWDEVVENLKRIADGREDLLNIVNLDREY